MSYAIIIVLWAELMGKQSNRKKFNRDHKRWIEAATALWDLAANRRIPDAIKLLFKMIGLRVVLALLVRKAGGDESVDAEAIKRIAASIEREQNKEARASHGRA